MNNLCISNIIIGLVSGIISGFFVNWISEKRKKKDKTYYFWMNYLFNTMEEYDIYIPFQTMNELNGIKGDFGKYIINIENILHPVGEDRELNDRESELADNVMNSLRELEKWNNKRIKNKLLNIIKKNK